MSTSIRWAGLYLAMAWAMCVLPPELAGQEQEGAGPPVTAVMLTVTIRGAEMGEGLMRIAIFDDPDRFTETPSASGVVPVNGGEVIWQVEVLPGRYAIAVIHDRDRNGELNRNFIGMPREPYGFSNDARGRTGPPSFEDASFHVGDGPLEIELTVR
ncbi:MAG: DUF2141 domain-containing protein [Gemmatimonadota bacterium]|jgi:uncharacterized protein (DUF2141 family)